MADWDFSTDGFRDPEEVLAQAVNRIGGAALARAARHSLVARGIPCSEVFPEDFGWVFFAESAGGHYLCAFSVEGGAGHAGVTRRRNILDFVLGRHRGQARGSVPEAVGAFLRGRPEIRDLRGGPG